MLKDDFEYEDWLVGRQRQRQHAEIKDLLHGIRCRRGLSLLFKSRLWMANSQSAGPTWHRHSRVGELGSTAPLGYKNPLEVLTHRQE